MGRHRSDPMRRPFISPRLSTLPSRLVASPLSYIDGGLLAHTSAALSSSISEFPSQPFSPAAFGSLSKLRPPSFRGGVWSHSVDLPLSTFI